MRIDMPQCGFDMCRKYSDGNCHAVGGQREGCEFRTLEEKHKPKKPIENFYDERGEEFYDERGEEFYDEGYVYSCPNCESEVGSFLPQKENGLTNKTIALIAVKKLIGLNNIVLYRNGENMICKHKNCFYRRRQNGNGIETCDYIIETGKPRGCPADDCDKFKPKDDPKPKLKF